MDFSFTPQIAKGSKWIYYMCIIAVVLSWCGHFVICFAQHMIKIHFMKWQLALIHRGHGVRLGKTWHNALWLDSSVYGFTSRVVHGRQWPVNQECQQRWGGSWGVWFRRFASPHHDVDSWSLNVIGTGAEAVDCRVRGTVSPSSGSSITQACRLLIPTLSYNRVPGLS